MRITRTIVAYAGATILTFACASTTSASPVRVGTSAQVTAAVKSSVFTKTVSPAVEATLKEFSGSSSFDLTGPSTFGACDPYNSEALALAPKPCFLGNLHGTKTIVLVGDSNVGNWVPALSVGLSDTPYRLAVFGFSSCGLANLPYAPSWGPLYERCRQWHANIPSAIRALHPVAVLAASGDVGTTYSNSVWVNGVKNLFVQATLGSPTTQRILIGTSPLFGESVVTCLTVHANPQDCSLEYTPGSGYYGGTLSRDSQIARAADATLIKTSTFLCSSDTCSPVIGNILVYSDVDHITIAYSSFLAKVLTSAVLAALK
ncbi:MAG: putative acyltransferase [Acidimicrobiaceae bacterium]|nr:putative acyltransferase [Acidimicrobiaceae bacterium]